MYDLLGVAALGVWTCENKKRKRSKKVITEREQLEILLKISTKIYCKKLKHFKNPTDSLRVTLIDDSVDDATILLAKSLAISKK